MIVVQKEESVMKGLPMQPSTPRKESAMDPIITTNFTMKKIIQLR